MNISELKKDIKPYKGIILFFIVMLVANFLWKLLVNADDLGKNVSICGIDISIFAKNYTSRVTQFASDFLNNILGMNTVVRGNKLWTDSQNNISIVWGCAGFKQMFIFSTILIFSPGSVKDKLWFIPLGCILCYFLNVFRIAMLALIDYNFDRETLYFCHDVLFKYLFYAIIFIFWVIWNEYNLAKNNNK